MKQKSLLCTIAMLALVALALPTSGLAKDAVSAQVVPTTPVPIVLNNGNPLSSGTFAVGTIQLFYTVNGFTFTPGEFSSFALNLGIKQGPMTGQQTQYPVTLSLSQVGSPNLILDPEPGSFVVSNALWKGSSTVHIVIPAATASDPSLNCDGCELVANLQLSAPGSSHLDTPTTVQVHIKLTHPTACLRVFDFITDEGFNGIVDSATVHLGGPANNRKVVSTSPGQFSDNILIVNGCSTEQSFNLNITLDSHFEPHPSNGHGNPVFTYFTTGYVDPSSFNLTAFGSGTPAGASLWLQDINLPAGDAFLATVHTDLISGNPPTWLPALSGTPATGIFSGFSAELYAPGTTLTSLPTAPPASLAVPNPAATSMAFTIQ